MINISKNVRTLVSSELPNGAANTYLNNLSRELGRMIPKGVSCEIKDTFCKDGISYVRITKNADSRAIPVGYNIKSSMETIESFRANACDILFRFFGI